MVFAKVAVAAIPTSHLLIELLAEAFISSEEVYEFVGKDFGVVVFQPDLVGKWVIRTTGS